MRSRKQIEILIVFLFFNIYVHVQATRKKKKILPKAIFAVQPWKGNSKDFLQDIQKKMWVQHIGMTFTLLQIQIQIMYTSGLEQCDFSIFSLKIQCFTYSILLTQCAFWSFDHHQVGMSIFHEKTRTETEMLPIYVFFR
jgi:hypothetical protein